MKHEIVFRDVGIYASHPHLVVAADGVWHLVFNTAHGREFVLHPPLDPDFRNVIVRSKDEGRRWGEPRGAPDDAARGMECAGLSALPDGSVLVNQWQFDWIDPDEAGLRDDVATALPEALFEAWRHSPEFDGLHSSSQARAASRHFQLARVGGRSQVFRVHGDGSFGPVRGIDTGPFAGGYGMRGAAVLDDGTVLLPLCDVPHYRNVFVVRSDDGGRTWSRPLLVAGASGKEFEEPAPVVLPNGELFMVMRENRTRVLHETRSADGGSSWSEPLSIGVPDYPADLALLHDGRLAMVAGRRHANYGVILYLSDDNGTNWGGAWTVRNDLPNRDAGYPAVAQRSNGDLVIVYYGRDDGVTSILQTVVPIDAIESG